MDLFTDKNRPSRLQKLGSVTETVVHDLNNHLMLALNHLVAGDATAARKSIESCSGLTASLLDFTRGPAMMRRMPLDAVVVETVMSIATPAGVELKASYGPLLPCVLINPREVSRALANLLFNAFAAVENQGTVKVDVNGRELSVIDTGCGIAPELLDVIFEPHFSTKGVSGTGLGLSIVRDIMRLHAGTVTVASHPGRGSTFTLRFPSRL